MFAFVALTVPAWIVPLAVRLFSPVRFVIVALVMFAFVAVIDVTFARLVILFCAFAAKVPLKVPPVILPLTFKLSKLPVVALTVAALIVLVTLKLVRPLMFVRFAFVALSVPACIVPLAVRLFSPVRFVIVAFVMFAFVAVIDVTFAKFVIEF